LKVSASALSVETVRRVDAVKTSQFGTHVPMVRRPRGTVRLGGSVSTALEGLSRLR